MRLLLRNTLTRVSSYLYYAENRQFCSLDNTSSLCCLDQTWPNNTMTVTTENENTRTFQTRKVHFLWKQWLWLLESFPSLMESAVSLSKIFILDVVLKVRTDERMYQESGISQRQKCDFRQFVKHDNPTRRNQGECDRTRETSCESCMSDDKCNKKHNMWTLSA